MTAPALAQPFSPLIEHAIELSAQWHDQTYRKGGWRPSVYSNGDEVLQVPVIAHVVAVGTTLARAGWDETTVAAGILHDAIEDEDRHGRTLAERALRTAIGDAVVDLIRYVTEQKLDEAGRMRSWQVRKEGYLDQLERAPVEALAISVADKLHNLWSINQALESGIDVFSSSASRRALTAGPDEQQWFYRSVLQLAGGVEDRRLAPIRAQLTAEVERFERLVR